VRTLGLLGEDAFVARLRRLGLEGLRESGDHYGPALALGSGDVSLWELVGAYRALARGGAWSPLRLGAEAPAGGEAPSPAYTPAAAFLVADILADREARSATFGLESPLATRFWTAVKTGTSRDMRDNWCVGFSRRYVVGVWVGNFSGEPMWNVSGVTGAAPAWLEIVSRLHVRMASEPPRVPPGVVRGRVRFADGVEPARPELFLRDTEPDTEPACCAVPASAAGSGREVTLPVVPARAAARIVAPAPGTIVAIDPGIPAARQQVLLEARPGSEAVRFVLDGIDLGPAGTPVFWAPRPGRHRLLLMDAGQTVHDSADFEVRGPGEPRR
jgi:penicillin-binding protein 1C